MEHPVRVALAEPVTALPRGVGWWYEPKFDGHRVVIRRDAESAGLQARSGRDVTSSWMDLAVAAMRLAPGTILDGEAVIWINGELSFSAVQSRAAASVAGARALAHARPASYAAWDLLAHPEAGDVRERPYIQRRQLLLDVLAPLGPPLQPVPATDDYETAMVWYESLQAQGIEGIVAKLGSSPYRAGRIWQKVRHTETLDAKVVGYTGSPHAPRSLVVRLADGQLRLSQRLTAGLAAQVTDYLWDAEPGQQARTDGEEVFTTMPGELVVEVLAGTTRHGVVTVTRVR
ncbi:DNA ligase (plasmid) [Streptomyces alboflavus]|uniref:DNA ligase n=1 Tax=Streptomyces alboflavus TaxID=67267 RepID=A0A291W5P7_9ACTN|nr:DNA ligase [Streptomyces alboflavus]ATM24862.1 DNA ligase [Streptomyces alboflavus]